jgi:hypothetical protein
MKQAVAALGAFVAGCAEDCAISSAFANPGMTSVTTTQAAISSEHVGNAR